MKGAVIFLSVLVAVAALARTATMPPLPAPAFADTEVVTNMPMLSVDVAMRRVSLSLAFAATPSNCVEVVFGTDLNDADVLDGGATNRPERIRPVTLNLQAPQGTSGIVLVSAEGDSGMELFRVVDGVTNRVNPMTAIPLSVTDGFACTGSCTIYASCPGIGSGVLSATFCPTNGGVATYLTADASFKCIEPLRKLVSMRQMPDGRFYNPSRLVMGTNAVLQVGVNGDFDATNVHWRVVSGPATVSPASGFTTTVTPTGTSEDVVVEARFNGDEIQPRFVLPVVMPRTIPVKAFVVKPPQTLSEKAWEDYDIRDMLDVANETFTQVGIRFELACEPQNVGTPDAWKIPMRSVVTNALGEVSASEYVSSQMLALLDNYRANDCVEVYFVGEILNLDVAAAWLETGIVMDRSANRFTLAHELGHALGLTDIYHEQEGMDAQGRKAMFTLGERANAAKSGYFSSHPWDWGEETGRGFYGRGDTLAATIERLLMHGRVSGWPGDIPDGRVFGMSRSFSKWHLKVGASEIERRDWKVYSK